METLQQYKNLGTTYLIPAKHTNPAQVGYARKVCVLYVIGRFGFSSKVVFEYLLKLPREAINKLFRKLVLDGLVNERKSEVLKDGSVYYLSSKGKRFLAYEANFECTNRSDTSGHNARNAPHDISIQICVFDRLLNSNGQYSAFVTEKELREIGYGTHSHLRHQRAVDSLLYSTDGNTKEWHALEVEFSNNKNKLTAKSDLRTDILKKYLNQLDSDNGLYQRVLFFSHRERFLRQIKTRHDNIILEDKLDLTSRQKELLTKNLKYIHSFCPMLYNIFWEPGFKLEKATHKSIELAKVAKLRKQVLNSNSDSEFLNGYRAALCDLELLDT